MAAWMLYAVLISLALGIGAFAAERVLRMYRRPSRWIWIGSLMASAAIPAAVRLAPRTVASSTAEPAPVIWLEPLTVAVASAASRPTLDAALAWAWALASLALAAFIVASLRGLRRRRSGWLERRVDGVPVLVSRSTGPAVVGVRRSAIVLPEWALALERHLRALVVEHEREHVRAGDPRLLALALALVIAMPWNPLLWWQLRRLRLAIEIDCDGRVLRRRSDLHGYGTVLLEVGRRVSRAGPVFGPALSEPHSFLERRIRMMTSTPPTHRGIRAGGLAVLAAFALVVACEAPNPEAITSTDDAADGGAAIVGEAPPPAPRPDRPDDEGSAAVRGTSDQPPPPVEPDESLTGFEQFEPSMTQPRITNSEVVEQELEASYPELLRNAGIGGATTVWFWIDETGAVQQTQIHNGSGYPALDEAALHVANTISFAPAEKDGEPVPVVVALPIRFTAN